MGIYTMSCSSYEENKPTKTSNPNPRKFIIESVYHPNIGKGWVIAIIIYPDCTNFEGRKVLLFRDTDWHDIYNATEIDPHFTDRNKYKGLIPFARFEPTEEGIRAAEQFCKIIT